MAAASPLLSLFPILFLLLLLPVSNAIYCDEDDCYDLLGHPDKNPDPESRKLFVKIANAYEVFYNTAQYYRAYYGHKTAIETVKQTPAYKNRLKALEFERTGGISSKKKGHKQMDKFSLGKFVGLGDTG
uniref:J domain-containing protein n=1 Tax=Leersia perrieri TaxID=77586 RepID=A0A0D9V1A5_9ORYZ